MALSDRKYGKQTKSIELTYVGTRSLPAISQDFVTVFTECEIEGMADTVDNTAIMDLDQSIRVKNRRYIIRGGHAVEGHADNLMGYVGEPFRARVVTASSSEGGSKYLGVGYLVRFRHGIRDAQTYDWELHVSEQLDVTASDVA